MLTELQTRKLLKLFSIYDSDCDGVLVQGDFDRVVKRIADCRNLRVRSLKYQVLVEQYQTAWKSLKDHADQNNDRQVDWDEWHAYYDELLNQPDSYEKIIKTRSESVFSAFDTDDDGQLTQDEWAELLSAFNVSPVYAPMTFAKLDFEQQGFLSKACLLQLVQEFYFSDDPNAPGNWLFGPF
jgi:Ca2+-binding EF-hand superfamily protein